MAHIFTSIEFAGRDNLCDARRGRDGSGHQHQGAPGRRRQASRAYGLHQACRFLEYKSKRRDDANLC